MNDVSGIDPGRTPVMFNGVQVGLVKSIDMGKDYSSATADLAMDPRVEDMLLEGTEFWTVKPSISLAGITGLEALVKGNYIDVRFAKSGAPSREFTIRPKAPPLNTDAPGLHLVLTSDKLGSIDIGAPILYRQVRVGSVQSYQLSRDRQRVVVGVHIEPEYAHLVNTSTRFWNSSGITLTGNLSGVQVKSESLQTLITGGISFDTLDPKAPTVTKVRRFTLFDSEEAAMARGVEIQLSIDNADGLREGTPIRFKGLDIGKIESVELNPDLSGVLMKARLTSAGERVARSGTRFWVVRPALGLLRTENLGTLVSGPYIEALPSSTPGERQARFQTRRSAQPAGPGKWPAADPQCAAQGLDQAGQPGDLPADPGGQGRRPGLGRTGRPGADQHPHRTALRTAGAYRQPFLECQRLRRRRQPVQRPVATHRVDGGADGGRHCLRHPEQCADGRARQAGADLRPVRFGQ